MEKILQKMYVYSRYYNVLLNLVNNLFEVTHRIKEV